MSQKIIKEVKKVVTSTQQRDVPQVVQVPAVVHQMQEETKQEPRVVTEQHIQNPDGSVTVVKKESTGTVGVDDVESKMEMEKQQRHVEGAGTTIR